MALSVPHSLGTEISFPNIDGCDWGFGPRRDTSDLRIYWVRGGRVERAKRPRASVGHGTAEGVDFGSDGTSQGTDGDEGIPSVPRTEEKALLGQSFLGQGILCRHNWSGCRNDPKVCPTSGAEREIRGATAVRRLGPPKRRHSCALPPLGAGQWPPHGEHR